MPVSATHYETLGLPQDADAQAIRRAHRTLARTYHPDLNKGKDASAHFARVQSAYETLIDPDKRAAYDTGLHRGQSWHPASPGSAGQTPTVNPWADLDREELTEELDEFWRVFFEPRAKARAAAARE